MICYHRLAAINRENSDSVSLIADDFAVKMQEKKGLDARLGLYHSETYFTGIDKFIAAAILLRHALLNDRKPGEVNENDLFINLGVAYQEKGRHAEAEPEYEGYRPPHQS